MNRLQQFTERFLPRVTNVLFCLYLLLMQTGLSYQLSLYFGDTNKIKSVFIIFIYLGGIALSGISFLASPIYRRNTISIALSFFLLLALPFLFDANFANPISKSFIIGMLTIIVFTSFAFTSSRLFVGKFMASISTVMAVLCLIDICFTNGLSNTLGRAASLYVNPNIAGLCLLLGGIGSIWAVLPKWRPAFLIIIFSSIFATLSRSCLLISCAVALASLPYLIQNWDNLKQQTAGHGKLTLASLLLAICFLTTAFAANSRFPVALANAFFDTNFTLQSGIQSLPNPTDTPLVTAQPDTASPQAQQQKIELIAAEKIADVLPPPKEIQNELKPETAVQTAAIQEQPKNLQATEKLPQESQATNAPVKIEEPTNTSSQTEQALSAEDQIVVDAEKKSSSAARMLMMQRAWNVYLSHAVSGIGLEKAFQYQPHNSYLLFALAYGYAGWLVIPLLLLFIWRMSPWRQNLPALTAIGLAAAFSHDLLLSNQLVCGLIIIIYGLLACRDTKQVSSLNMPTYQSKEPQA